MRLRYDKKADTLQLLVRDEEVSSTKAMDEDVSVAYDSKGGIMKITVNKIMH